MHFARDLAERGIRTALRFHRAGRTIIGTREVKQRVVGCSLARGSEALAAGTGVAILLRVKHEVITTERAVLAS